MPRLTSEQKAFIVQRLACFDTPTVVMKAVKEELGIEVSRQAVQTYDPTSHQGRNLTKKWREMFEATRESFLEDTSGIAISHKAVRLRALQRMAEKAESMSNLMLAKDLLEQAAKESGDAYSNRRVHQVTGEGGGPVQTQEVPLTREQLIEEAKKRGLPTQIFDE